MKKLLYILLFAHFVVFGQEDLLLNYMNCIESYEQELSSIQSQIIEKNNSIASTETQFLEVLAYCNMYSVEEQIYDYCYSEVVSSFGVILVDLEYEIDSLQIELVTIQDSLDLNIPCGDNPFDVCMYVLCEDTYDSTTINADFDCINPEHILGSTSFCCSNYFCGMPGCKDISACNYDDNAEVDDGSCIYSIGDCVENIIDKWYLSRDLESGWNMFGYGCPSPIDVAEYLSSYTDNIIIAKDNNGAVYIPEWGFNGIGDFTPGFGYQIKLTEAIEGFSLCDWYASDLVDGSVTNIENENIILNSNNSNLLDSLVITQSINADLQQDVELTILQNNILLVLVQSLNQVLEENVLLQDSLIANIVSLQEENASLQAELDSIYGCTYSWACNYDETAILNDGSCYDNDLGCGCDAPGPIEGLDCEGNELPEYQVGDFALGGIIFFIDSTGQHGLVAATEDLTEGATLGNWEQYGYEWGLFNFSEVDAGGVSIGTGYQNTINIVNQGGGTVHGGISAAHAALDAEINGYSDWYLPSKDELSEMINTIGYEGPEGNIAGFVDGGGLYWSSSKYHCCNSAWVGFSYDGFMDAHTVDWHRRVRAIRSF